MVTDHRTTPKGVLPRRTQMWVMLGVALGVLAIVVFAGHPAPAPRTTPMPAQMLAPNPDRLRDFQVQLRALDDRTRQQAMNQAPTPTTRPTGSEDPAPAAGSAAATDPVVAERKRREYESLFASNVVFSRRPAAQQPAGSESPLRGMNTALPPAAPVPPSIDQVADAVVRATSRYAPDTSPSSANATSSGSTLARSGVSESPRAARRVATGPISSAGPLHRIPEGTVIDTVLTNRLEGSTAAPVNCLVTNPIYSYDGQHVLVPAGSRVLGETKPVQAFGETRLAVAFNRLLLPDGTTYPLDQFMGLNEVGDAGLKDQVDQHYRSTFGASAAVGLITGFAQYLGAAGFGNGANGNTVIIAGGMTESTAQATTQTLNRFLNRLPTITIHEGHRIKVYLTADLELPAYDTASRQSHGLLASSADRRMP